MLSWDEAQAECRQKSAHLLVFTESFYSPFLDTNSVGVNDIGSVYKQLQKFINETSQY
jgi:hypothetical protein